MAKPIYLIDSVIFIDHLLGKLAATNWLQEIKQNEAVISSITRAEVLAGAENVDEENLIFVLLDSYKCLDLTAPVADLAAKLRRKYGLKIPDAFQAALAESWDLTLVTRNTKDFPPRKFTNVLVPYKL